MIRQRIVTCLTTLGFGLYYITLGGAVTVSSEQKVPEKSYIVGMESAEKLEGLEKELAEQSETGEINDNGEGNLKNNYMIPLALTEEKADELAEDPGVAFVEEDVCVRANNLSVWKDKTEHKKKLKVVKRNKSKTEWNIRMIHADKLKKKKKTKKKDRIKIAVLDSGVDYGNDIDIDPSKTISLVPGESEITPLFMDGTGHGNSVAGLIAARDNGKGITGINPDAEIISIRVLDDNNSSPVSRVVEGIYMAIKEEADIINMSFGVNVCSKALEQAVQDAEQAGILLVAAAGNTGDKGVQYPAAFNEVMAVGSVDQYGDIAKSSAVGDEVEIVAPGELVRSTGFFDDELVSSGTSLAAPQVAAAASLIWEKDMEMPADFVRELLSQSANSYGAKEKYGNGLLDTEYALENYNEFKKSYQKKENSASVSDQLDIKQNNKSVLGFHETGCVEGSWEGKDHKGLIPEEYKSVRKGVIFPDNKEYLDSNGDFTFRGMKINPWWHGYYSRNYVAAYIHETRLANAFTTGKGVPYSVILKEMAPKIQNDISRINWKKEYGKTPTNAQKRAFVWGMAIHNLQDTFAHSTFIDKTGKKDYIRFDHANNNQCDDVDKYRERYYTITKKAVDAAMRKYKDSSHPSGTYEEFSSVLEATQFKLGHIYQYIKELAGDGIAKPYKNVSYK